MKTLVLSYDCFDFEFVMEHSEWFPNISKFLKDTGYFKLLLDIPTTLPIYSSIITGVPVSEHGIDHTGLDKMGKFFNLNHLQKYKFIWEGSKRTVGLFRWPLVYPAPEVNGWVAGGTGFIPESFYPKDLSKYHYKGNVRFHDYRKETYNILLKNPNSPLIKYELSGLMMDAINVALDLTRNFINIYQTNPVDIVMVYYYITDFMVHKLSSFKNYYLPVLAIMDVVFDMIISYVKPDEIIFFADHGAHPLPATDSMEPFVAKVNEVMRDDSNCIGFAPGGKKIHLGAHKKYGFYSSTNNAISQDRKPEGFGQLLKREVFQKDDSDLIQQRLEALGYV